MSLVFDGTNDYAEIANGYDCFSGLASATFSCWAKCTSLAALPFLVSTKSLGVGGLFIEVAATTGFYWGANGSYITSTHKALSNSTWFHVLVVNRAGRGGVWVNGVPEFSVNQNTYSTSASKTLYLGRYDSGAPYYLAGKLYDVRAWGRELYPAEIRRVWAGQDVTSGLTGKWLLNESSGSTFADSAGSKSGALFNGPTWDSDFPTYGTLDASESAGSSRPVNALTQQVI